MFIFTFRILLNHYMKIKIIKIQSMEIKILTIQVLIDLA